MKTKPISKRELKHHLFKPTCEWAMVKRPDGGIDLHLDKPSSFYRMTSKAFESRFTAESTTFGKVIQRLEEISRQLWLRGFVSRNGA